MKDPRNQTLAHNLVNFSTALKKGETLYLEVRGRDTLDLARAVMAEATKVGANTFFYYNDNSILRQFLKNCTVEQIEALADMHLEIMKKSAAYIGMNGTDNLYDLSDINPDIMQAYNKIYFHKVHHGWRVPKTRWCVLRYPSVSFATNAEKPQEVFEDFFYDVCCLDYSKLSRAMDPLVELMQKTDKVRIVSPGTDISFSIKGIPAIKCDGKLNIPDGEVFTAPVKDSINGVIQYNTPTENNGKQFRNIRLEFKDGKIINFSGDGDRETLDKIFNTDEGARYVGEFAIGVNPYINDATRSILFDEKIYGSIHLTPGASYDEAPNGNDSAVHWDLVLIQTPKYGGGELYFDGRLVRKDGEFVIPELKALSREALIGKA
jgi:aminopeptidase